MKVYGSMKRLRQDFRSLCTVTAQTSPAKKGLGACGRRKGVSLP